MVPVELVARSSTRPQSLGCRAQLRVCEPSSLASYQTLPASSFFLL